MRLLIITQVVDKQHTDLGFFHAWLCAFAAQVDSLTVICLQEGEHELPKNVRVLSLKKEHSSSCLMRFCYFYQYLIRERRQYDAVFVHMNPEYVLLGGLLWRLQGKHIALWYTHKAVNLRLRIASRLTHTIFTASSESFRLKTPKVQVMGHGIDLGAIPFDPSHREPGYRLLLVGRIAPVKDIETAIQTMRMLRERPEFTEPSLDIVGEPVTETDRVYYASLVAMTERLGLSDHIRFLGGLPHSQIGSLYSTHRLLIHTSHTGSIDKVVLEALAAGMPVVSTSEAFGDMPEDLIGTCPTNNPPALAQAIEKMLAYDMLEHALRRRAYVTIEHNLNVLIGRIIHALSV